MHANEAGEPDFKTWWKNAQMAVQAVHRGEWESLQEKLKDRQNFYLFTAVIGALIECANVELIQRYVSYTEFDPVVIDAIAQGAIQRDNLEMFLSVFPNVLDMDKSLTDPMIEAKAVAIFKYFLSAAHIDALYIQQFIKGRHPEHLLDWANTIIEKHLLDSEVYKSHHNKSDNAKI